MLALLLAPVASAQINPPPTFDLQAPPAACSDADTGFTCVSYAKVINYHTPIVCGSNCHLEYCFTNRVTGSYADCPPGSWRESVPDTPIRLGQGLTNGTYPVYSEYRQVSNGTISSPSQYGTAYITLISTNPAVDVNSPAGISGSVAQVQWINGHVGQYVTYHAASTGAGIVKSVKLQSCVLSPQSCSIATELPPTQFTSPSVYTKPSVWPGWTPGTSIGDN